MKKKKIRKEKIKKPLKINYKLIGSILILLALIYLNFNPKPVNLFLSKISNSNCDYKAMATDIKKVIYFHTVASRVFKMPVNGSITSPFGEREDPITNEKVIHTGIDIDAPLNTPIYSAYDGKVLRVEENEYYGKFIMIEHFGSLVSLYGHLNEQNVKIGDLVTTETVIGKSGQTGRVTGAHLHFEIRKDEECVDPEDYMLWKI